MALNTWNIIQLGTLGCLDMTYYRPPYLEGTQEEADILSNLAISILGPNCTFIDVGSFKGGSAILFGKIVKGYGKVFTVDFKKNDEVVVKQHIKEEELDNEIIQIFTGSEEAAKQFPNNSIEFVYIDDGHTYSEMMRDLQSWYPKVKIGGIICGHDCHGHFLNDYTEEQQLKLRNTQNSGYDDTNKTDPLMPLLPHWKKELLQWWDFPRIHSGVVCAVYDFFCGEFTQYKGTSIFSHTKE
jgi:predicted O-methyltransferase YrrM